LVEGENPAQFVSGDPEGLVVGQGMVPEIIDDFPHGGFFVERDRLTVGKGVVDFLGFASSRVPGGNKRAEEGEGQAEPSGG
jgi:hypothetical protein